MNVSAVGGMDLATMRALMSGATAMKQVSEASSQSVTLPTDQVTLQMSAKVLDGARQALDVLA